MTGIDVDAELFTNPDGSIAQVFINGTDMTDWIARDGLTIQPGSVGRPSRLTLTLVATTVTYQVVE